MTDPLIQIGGNAERKIADMEAAPWMRGTRGATSIQANIAIAATVDVPIIFDKALPSATYSPQVTLEGSSGILGNLSAIIKGGSLTTTGCVVQVKNSALISLGINVVVHVTATY